MNHDEMEEVEYSGKECIRCANDVESDSQGLEEGYCAYCWDQKLKLDKD